MGSTVQQAEPDRQADCDAAITVKGWFDDQGF